jgi:hypothetical protein
MTTRFQSFADRAPNAIVGVCTAPARALRWATGSTGGKAVIGVLATYCAALSVESWYVAMPIIAGKESASVNRKFVPKPFIDDGADLGLLNPLPVAGAVWGLGVDIFSAMLPFSIKGAPPKIADCVWLDWRFYIALSASLALQIWQAKAIRAVSISARRTRAERLAVHKTMKLDPNSLKIAQSRAAEYNSSLTGHRATNGAMIALSYLVELGTGAVSISQSMGIGALTAAIYCVIQAFGFEVLINHMEDQEELES